MDIKFSEDELVTLRDAILEKTIYLARVQDPRIEHLVELDDKISKALGIEPSVRKVFFKVISEYVEECHEGS